MHDRVFRRRSAVYPERLLLPPMNNLLSSMHSTPAKVPQEVPKNGALVPYVHCVRDHLKKIVGYPGVDLLFFSVQQAGWVVQKSQRKERVQGVFYKSRKGLGQMRLRRHLRNSTIKRKVAHLPDGTIHQRLAVRTWQLVPDRNRQHACPQHVKSFNLCEPDFEAFPILKRWPGWRIRETFQVFLIHSRWACISTLSVALRDKEVAYLAREGTMPYLADSDFVRYVL